MDLEKQHNSELPQDNNARSEADLFTGYQRAEYQLIKNLLETWDKLNRPLKWEDIEHGLIQFVALNNRRGVNTAEAGNTFLNFLALVCVVSVPACLTVALVANYNQEQSSYNSSKFRPSTDNEGKQTPELRTTLIPIDPENRSVNVDDPMVETLNPLEISTYSDQYGRVAKEKATNFFGMPIFLESGVFYPDANAVGNQGYFLPTGAKRLVYISEQDFGEPAFTETGRPIMVYRRIEQINKGQISTFLFIDLITGNKYQATLDQNRFSQDCDVFSVDIEQNNLQVMCVGKTSTYLLEFILPLTDHFTDQVTIINENSTANFNTQLSEDDIKASLIKVDNERNWTVKKIGPYIVTRALSSGEIFLSGPTAYYPDGRPYYVDSFPTPISSVVNQSGIFKVQDVSILDNQLFMIQIDPSTAQAVFTVRPIKMGKRGAEVDEVTSNFRWNFNGYLINDLQTLPLPNGKVLFVYHDTSDDSRIKNGAVVMVFDPNEGSDPEQGKGTARSYYLNDLLVSNESGLKSTQNVILTPKGLIVFYAPENNSATDSVYKITIPISELTQPLESAVSNLGDHATISLIPPSQKRLDQFRNF